MLKERLYAEKLLYLHVHMYMNMPSLLPFDPSGLGSHSPKALGQLAPFKLKLESNMSMKNTSCTLASTVYFDIEEHLS